MPNKHKLLFSCIGVLAIGSLAIAEPPLAEVSYFGSSVEFSPTAWGHGFILKVMAPDGSVVQKTVKDGVPGFDLSELAGGIIDGRYKYELRLIVSAPRARRDRADSSKTAQKPPIRVPSLSGSFLVSGGSIMSAGGVEPSSLSATQGVPDAPDYEIIDDLCVGSGCVSGETFPTATTLKLKENDTGILFQDTSSTSGFPTDDWHLRANDTTSGGASYFAIDDVDGGTTPFTIEAGSPNDSLYVDSYGRTGFKTSTPAVELHVTDGDSPTVRLEQDGSSGYTPQNWDVAGNETSFYIRDVTIGSAIPLEIQAGTPSESLCLKADGKVGLGTWTPAYAVEVERTGSNSVVVVDRTDGVTNYINATASFGNFGTVTDHPLRLVVNSAWKMRINNDSSISMANGASLTTGGVWTDASSRALKENIEDLSVAEATAALTGLAPVKFAYKSNGERHVGFVAEDVPALVASADRSGLSPMDVVAVLTRVVQQQQSTIQAQQTLVEAQQRKLLAKDRLDQQQQATIKQLMERISALESR